MVNTSGSKRERENLALFFVVQLTRKLFKAKKKKKMLVTFGGKSFIAGCFGFIGEQIHSQVLGKKEGFPLILVFRSINVFSGQISKFWMRMRSIHWRAPIWVRHYVIPRH